MNELIKKIEQVKEHLPANVGFEFENIKPNLNHAFRTHILPILTRSGYQQLIQMLANSPEGILWMDGEYLVADNDESLIVSDVYSENDLENAVLELATAVRAAICQLGMLHYLPMGQVVISTNAITNQTTNTHKTAQRWQIDAIKESLQEMGQQSLEYMLEVLEHNKTLFTEWAKSPVATRYATMLLPNTEEFEHYQSLNGSRLMFRHLAPTIQQVETLMLSNIIGNELLLALKKNDRPADMDQFTFTAILNNAKGYVAARSLTVGLHRSSIGLGTDGAIQVNSSGTAGGKKGADLNLLNAIQRQYREAAMLYEAKLEELLQDTFNQTPLYESEEGSYTYFL